MKKNLLLLSLIGLVSLAGCSTMPTPSPFADPAPLQSGASWVTPTTPARPLPVVIGGIVGTPPPSPTVDGPEQSWLAVTALTVERPDTGGPCTAVITVTELSGRVSHQFVGPQRLVFTQRRQGEPVTAPTFTLSVDGKQIWLK